MRKPAVGTVSTPGDHTTGTEATDLAKLGVRARRALLNAGYTRLEHLTEVTQSEVIKLHGIGPKAMGVLRNALQERGLSFRDG
jgi:DNA-directed RNA polymerase alpha subunit